MEDQKETPKKENEDKVATESSETLSDSDVEDSPEGAAESSAENAGKVDFEGSVLDHLEQMIPWNVFFLGLGIVFLLLTIWNR